MARSFNGTTDKGALSSAVITAAPATISAWFNPSSSGTSMRVFSSTYNGGVDGSGWMLFIHTTNAVRSRSCDNTICASATSSTTATASAWNHGCVVFTNNASRTTYLNGGGSTTDTTAMGTITATNESVIGSGGYNNGYVDYFSGNIAEIGVWNVALSVDEITSLSKGFSPLLIRPQSLIEYIPIIGRNSPEVGLKGRQFTLTGTGNASHPRIFY